MLLQLLLLARAGSAGAPGGHAAAVTYPYPGLTANASSDGLPRYTGAGDAEACPPSQRRACAPCPARGPCDKGCPTLSKSRCCEGTHYCAALPAAWFPGSEPVWGSKTPHPLRPITRRQILERALGWVALGLEYKWPGDGSGQPFSAIESCAAADPDPDCPHVRYGGSSVSAGPGPDCSAFVEMAWQIGLGSGRSNSTSVRVDCADVQPGDAVSYQPNGPGNSATGFPHGSHIFLFREWTERSSNRWRIYQMGGEVGKANEAVGGQWPTVYEPDKMYCLRRLNLVDELTLPSASAESVAPPTTAAPPPPPSGWPRSNWSTVPTYTFCGPVSRFFNRTELEWFAGSGPGARGYRPRWIMLGYSTLSNYSLRPGLEPAGNNIEKQGLVMQQILQAAPDMPVFASTAFDITLCGQQTGRRHAGVSSGYCSMEIDSIMRSDPEQAMLMRCNGSVVRRTGCSPTTPGAITPYVCSHSSGDNRTIHNWTNPHTRQLYAGMYRNWSRSGATGGFLDGPKWAWPVFGDWPYAGGCSRQAVDTFFRSTETAIREIRGAIGWESMVLCNDGEGLGNWTFETPQNDPSDERGQQGDPMCSGTNFEFMQGKLHDVLGLRAYARTHPSGDGSFVAVRALHTSQSHHGVVSFGENASMFARTINGFLVSAGRNHYYHWFADYRCDSETTDHLKDIPEYSKPLGDPVKTTLHSVAVHANGSRSRVNDCSCARSGSLTAGYSPLIPDWPPSPLPPGLGGDGRPPTGGVVGLGPGVVKCECVLTREFASGTKSYYNGTSWRIPGCAARDDKRQCGARQCSDQSCDEACNCVGVSTASCTSWADGSTTESSGCSSDKNPGTSASWSRCGSGFRAGCDEAAEHWRAAGAAR